MRSSNVDDEQQVRSLDTFLAGASPDDVRGRHALTSAEPAALREAAREHQLGQAFASRRLVEAGCRQDDRTATGTRIRRTQERSEPVPA
jgi:hypothetical protein